MQLEIFIRRSLYFKDVRDKCPLWWLLTNPHIRRSCGGRGCQEFSVTAGSSYVVIRHSLLCLRLFHSCWSWSLFMLSARKTWPVFWRGEESEGVEFLTGALRCEGRCSPQRKSRLNWWMSYFRVSSATEGSGGVPWAWVPSLSSATPGLVWAAQGQPPSSSVLDRSGLPVPEPGPFLGTAAGRICCAQITAVTTDIQTYRPMTSKQRGLTTAAVACRVQWIQLSSHICKMKHCKLFIPIFINY